jgi:hypothetical protein
MLMMKPTEIAMLPPKLNADEPLPIPKVPLSPTLLVLVFNDRLPNMPTIPALLFDMATLPKLVATQMPDEMVIEPPKAILPSMPSIVTAPPLVLPSPKVRAKLPPLLVNDDPEMINTTPPAVPDKLPAFTLNAPPMLVLEFTEIAVLLLELDADKPLLISKVPQLPMLAVPVFINESPNTPAVPALLVNTAMLPKLVAMPTPDEVMMEPPKAVLPLPPWIVIAPPLVLPSPKARVKLPRNDLRISSSCSRQLTSCQTKCPC